ncbi:MAG: transporter [Gammaproteobacteria bacterium]|nr:transporter [Gammaproteobacteria bacterium]
MKTSQAYKKAGRSAHVLAVLLVGVGGWTGQARGAPITFNTALPVAKGEFFFREQLVVNQSGDDPSGLDRDRRAEAAVSVLGYGVDSKLALFGVLPYERNELKLTSSGQRVTRRASGFGDLTVFGRYTLVQRDEPGSNFRVAPFAGIKSPTGEDKENDTLGRLPPSVQLGSGSWDPLAGVVMTYQTLDYQVDGQFSYQANNEANGFEAGDVARLDGSLQYRLWPRTLSGGVPAFLYGVIEANLIHQGKDRVDGTTDPNSGGTRLFLTPGIQYVTKRWIAEAAMQAPVSQNLNGTALENDYIARVSVRFNF